MDSSPKKILVIDDNAANLTVINGILSRIYKVYPVNSGMTALKFLEKQRPDLILLDVEMPDMDGFELYEIIRTNTKLSHIPVIFLTANGDTESEAAVFKLGAADYMRKPVVDVTVLARVKMQLELAEYRKNNA